MLCVYCKLAKLLAEVNVCINSEPFVACTLVCSTHNHIDKDYADMLILCVCVCVCACVPML